MTTLSLFTNRATAKLAVAVSAGDSALTLDVGGGAWFPAPGPNEFFRLVLQTGTAQTDQREYMVCTTRAGDVLTVTRGQEGTVPAAFNVGDEVSLVITGLTATSFVQRDNLTLQGALEVEAAPTTPLGIANKAYVDTTSIDDVPDDGVTYGREFGAWNPLGDAASLPIPIPVDAGGTGGDTLEEAQLNLIIGRTTIDDLVPTVPPPKYGDRWIKPSNMSEYVWVPNQGGGGEGVWINPLDSQSEAYPIPITKGGTGATTAAQARINLGGTTVGIGVFTAATQAAGRAALGIDTLITGYLPITGVTAMTGALKLFDGTKAAPGIAFATEPGLGMHRSSPGVILWDVQGNSVFGWDGNGAAMTSMGVWPRAAGTSSLAFSSVEHGNPNSNTLMIGADQGGYFIKEALNGTATARQLSLIFPSLIVCTTPVLSSSGRIQAGSGRVSMSGDDVGHYLSFNNSVEGAWSFKWDVATGQLRYRHATPGTLDSVFSGDGDFYAGRDLYTGTPGGNNYPALIGSASNENYIKWGSANWRLSWIPSTGDLVYMRGSDNVTLMHVNSSGSVRAGSSFSFTGDANYYLGWTGNHKIFQYSTNWYWFWDSSNGNLSWARDGNAASWVFHGGGVNLSHGTGYKPNGGVWDTYGSDRRLKDIVGEYDGGLDGILKLKPKLYRYKAATRAGDMLYCGLVADEAVAAMPEMKALAQDNRMGDIVGTRDAPLLSLNLNYLAYATINAIKTLNDRLTALERK